MTGLPRLGLGAVQFGTDYGITNERGRVPEDEVALILDGAAAAGIDLLDTAPIYADSEAVLGRSMSKDRHFRVVTKTPKFGGRAGPDSAGALRLSLEESLLKLKLAQVHGLIFHDPADLLGPNGDRLWASMESLRDQGLVGKIGLSAYTGAELGEALSRYPIELVQLPFNALDHRLIEGGQLRRLRAAGVEIHARSLFLQGLLLSSATSIAPKFLGLGSALEELDMAAAAHGFSRLEAVLAAAFAHREIDRFICGVTSQEELGQIVEAARRVTACAPLDFAPSSTLDERVLNPGRWNEL